MYLCDLCAAKLVTSGRMPPLGETWGNDIPWRRGECDSCKTLANLQNCPDYAIQAENVPLVDFDLTDRETIFTSLPRGGVGAEIGVDFGEFSKVILRNAEPRLLYLVDCWEQQPTEVTGHDPANYRQEIKDAAYHQVLGWFLADKRVRVVKGYSEKVAPLFPDDFFNWLYLDANHLRCGADLRAFWPKIKPGGWIMGHDYVTGGVGDFITVQADVDEFSAEHKLPMLLTDDPIYKNYVIQKP